MLSARRLASTAGGGRFALDFGSRSAPAVVSLAWLRDHDPNHLHPTSQQRQFDTAELGGTSALLEASDVSVVEGKLRVRWADRSASVFDGAWLADNAPREGADAASAAFRAARRSPTWGLPAARPWRTMTKDAVPHVSARSVPVGAPASDVSPAARRVLDALAVTGVALVTDMPSSAAETERIVRALVGPPRETFYGEMWDTAPRNLEDVNDTAYTKDALDGHTDTTYLADSPGLQCFNCVAQSGPPAAKDEGATKLLDALHLASELRRVAPDAYRFFCETPLVFHHIERGVNTRHTAPVFRVDPASGELLQMRYNAYDLAPLSYLTPDQVDEFYAHNAALARVVRDPANMALCKLGVGEMIVVQNHRVLHGRTAFKGYRNLVGCYVGMDDWVMRARAAASAG